VPESAAKDAFRTLVKEAIATGLPLDRLRGIAHFDPTRDAPLLALISFNVAAQAIGAIPNFIDRYGEGAALRIVLQFLYQYFKRLDRVRHVEATFDALWLDFTVELENANWVTRGVANLRNFDSDSRLLELGDGITIRGRSDTDLALLGFDAAVWERITEDWRTPGASSFVMVTEHSVAKRPDNLIFLDSSSVSQKAMRAIGALRLAGSGGISIGPMWIVRAARFNVGLGGLVSTGVSIPAYGSPYGWTEAVSEAFPSIYQALKTLEIDGYGGSPGNLAVALRAFMATYDRYPLWADSQLLDSITALEALLGGEAEISFKLSFRVASILATSDEERSRLLRLVKDFYDTRSRLVHGDELSEKRQKLLQHIDQLRAIVRTLLRCFVAFAVAPREGYGKAFWKEQLDVTLVDATARERLRATLGLTK
jgi:hypothetical protein